MKRFLLKTYLVLVPVAIGEAVYAVNYHQPTVANFKASRLPYTTKNKAVVAVATGVLWPVGSAINLYRTVRAR